MNDVPEIQKTAARGLARCRLAGGKQAEFGIFRLSKVNAGFPTAYQMLMEATVALPSN